MRVCRLCKTRARRSAKGRLRSTCSWARRTLAAATRRMASVILRVFLTEPMRSRISLRLAMAWVPQAATAIEETTVLMASLRMASEASLSCFSPITALTNSGLLLLRYSRSSRANTVT